MDGPSEAVDRKIRDWIDDEPKMISLALTETAKMEEACRLLIWSDGLMYDQGQPNAGISDNKRIEIVEWIFSM